MEPETSFCDLCRKLLDPKTWVEKESPHIEHHEYVQELYHSAVSGCRFCTTILQMGWETCDVTGRLAELDPALHEQPGNQPTKRPDDPSWAEKATYALELYGSSPKDPLNPPATIAEIRMKRWGDVSPITTNTRFKARLMTFTERSRTPTFPSVDIQGRKETDLSKEE